jgi:ABC-type transport system involved in cytochrome c biogenesis permease subunit
MTAPALAAFALMGAAAAVQISYLLRGRHGPDPVSHFILLAAAAALCVVIIDRSIRIRFPALTGSYESLLFFSAAVCIAAFILRIALKERIPEFVLFGATILALTLLALSSSPLAPKDVKPPIPALQSAWLVLHVSFAFIGEAFFGVGFAAGLAWLAVRSPERRETLNRVAAAAISIGYPIYTAGALVFGAVWAEAAWGSWWSWDPKETWALIVWLNYAAWLHMRLMKGLRGTVASWWALAGLGVTTFAFIGVNMFLSGLHSYGAL